MGKHHVSFRKGSWRGFELLLLGVLFLVSSACASSVSHRGEQEDAQPPGKEVIVSIDGGTFVPTLSERIVVSYEQSMQLVDALKQSGTVKVSEDKSAIVSVGDVALDPKMEWGLLLNGKEFVLPFAMDKKLKPDDVVGVFIKKMEVRTNHVAAPSVTLRIEGGTVAPNITNSYLVRWTEELTLQELVQNFAQISLDEDHKHVLRIGEKEPDVKAVLSLKVNDKKLNYNQDAERKLKPDDEIEINITP
ncbi:hypothetical protein M5W83_19050 [Paenibacillus thiaminolyticus]|uniref:Uncharacterized protein n=1 Tax=Paenibacillus thiaminolyticus TaxID=49283 RepID=A0AAP9DS52_PANTH|nr:hypothetical protein [Paenibacillus thiaminolyticus]MCY9536418.1 hypothetical protein [Paenibacillus thiaminolyticus]MCY9601430.1 hypothetical protein [Paenibacillus thiaminolyticus]MCY9609248.1 hypothetical protein [Paenibacillus thiaminolyticus]MCY9613085.1 hypothetical protein [Paenibacillus thiaminolyticus]MCY9616931.1 hypothetical protein [Paenibacillus thiaminolyticus]